MANTALPVINVPNSYAGAVAGITWTAADPANGNQFTLTEREVLLARNAGTAAMTVTVTSVADQLNRTRDITAYSIAASTFAIIGQFKRLGWAQEIGALYLSVGGTAGSVIQFAPLRLPSRVA